MSDLKYICFQYEGSITFYVIMLNKEEKELGYICLGTIVGFTQIGILSD